MFNLNRVMIAVGVLSLVACSTSSISPSLNQSYQKTSFQSLPQYPQVLAPENMQALLLSCQALQKKPTWQGICTSAKQVDPQKNAQIQQFFERNFDVWQIKDKEKNSTTGLVTGYYEPLLRGSLSPTERARYPIYGVPEDMLSLSISPDQLKASTTLYARSSGSKRLSLVQGTPLSSDYVLQTKDFTADTRSQIIRVRIDAQQLKPYFKRDEIEAGQATKLPILAYAEDSVELFFLQVQGSGRIQLADGSLLRLGYADQNGWPYKSIGRYLADAGHMPISSVSMQSIIKWVQDNPDKRQALLNINPSYVFFKSLGQAQGGPIGAQGVPLTDAYSIAVDPKFTPYGSPVFLSTTYPLSSKPLNRLVMAQDTGGAIRGAVRADFFWGFGDEAGRLAGQMKQTGQMWVLVPKGIEPYEGLKY